MTIRKRPAWIWIAAIVAVVFGLMSVKSGGSVLFLNGDARYVAGGYVSLVLWFNYLAGFFYVTIGIGIWQERPWVPSATATLAILTLLVFGVFGIEIIYGGDDDLRTIIAMSVRTLVWVVIAITSWRRLLWRPMQYKNAAGVKNANLGECI